MKHVMAWRQHDSELVRRHGLACGDMHRLLLAHKPKTLMDDVLSVVSPGVHPILRIFLVGRIAKLPEQVKLTSVDVWVNKWPKRHAVTAVRHATIAAIGSGGARIRHY